MGAVRGVCFFARCIYYTFGFSRSIPGLRHELYAKQLDVQRMQVLPAARDAGVGTGRLVERPKKDHQRRSGKPAAAHDVRSIWPSLTW